MTVPNKLESTSTHLFWEILFLGIHHHKRAVLGGVEAGEGNAQDFHEEAGSTQMSVEILRIIKCVKCLPPKCEFSSSINLEVGVNVIGVPVQGVVLHLEVVARKVARGVSQVVVLVPQDAL